VVTALCKEAMEKVKQGYAEKLQWDDIKQASTEQELEDITPCSSCVQEQVILGNSQFIIPVVLGRNQAAKC